MSPTAPGDRTDAPSAPAEQQTPTRPPPGRRDWPGPAPQRSVRRRDLSPRAFASATGDFLSRVWKKIGDDNIFFLGGAIAFKVVIAIVPLILAMVGIAGLLLRTRYGQGATEEVMRILVDALPALGPDALDSIRTFFQNEILADATGFLSVGSIFLVWIATSLIGTLRTVLREIFDLQEDRGMVVGKIFDIQMVFAAGTLLALNVLLTIGFRIVASFDTSVIGIEPARFAAGTQIFINAAGFVSIWFMFVLIYRYLPSRRIQWKIAMISATFTGILYELLKSGFGWYVTNVAIYRNMYGNFTTVFVFLLWIYYMSVAFVIGGEVGQVAALRRIRRRQKERLN